MPRSATLSTEHVVRELGVLIRDERLLEKLLERASRLPEDPREVAYLWNLATECRDHARILTRHRRQVCRDSEEIPYPHWPRGRGPLPVEALELGRELALTLAGEYHACELLSDDPYLRKFLAILSDEHRNRALEIKGIANGSGIFEQIEETIVD